MTPPIIEWASIEAALENIDAVAAMERAFDAYSRGEAVIGPVGELLFEAPPGDVHIEDVKTGKIGEAKVEGDSAKIEITFGADGSKKETVELKKVGDKWYLAKM